MKDPRVNPAPRGSVFGQWTYRADGWPLCPSCGEDELMSGSIPARATDALQCLNCFWQGIVPPRTGLVHPH